MYRATLVLCVGEYFANGLNHSHRFVAGNELHTLFDSFRILCGNSILLGGRNYVYFFGLETNPEEFAKLIIRYHSLLRRSTSHLFR